MEEKICRIVESALALPAGSVTAEGTAETIASWDSLGLLSILSALEKEYGARVAAIDDLSGVRSVKDIVALFEREGIT